MGRKKSNDKRSEQYRLRMSKEDKDRLDYLSMKKNQTRAEIIRKALEMYYNLSIYQK